MTAWVGTVSGGGGRSKVTDTRLGGGQTLLGATVSHADENHDLGTALCTRAIALKLCAAVLGRSSPPLWAAPSPWSRF